MEIGPILRTLFRNKTRFILITLEVALTLAIVVNCINMMLDLKHQMDRPTGIQGVDVLGVKLIQGRNFTLSDINDSESNNVIITKAYADRMFPDGDALGKQIQGREPDNPDTIVGIIQKMHGSWPTWPYASAKLEGDIDKFIENLRSQYIHFCYSDIVQELVNTCNLLGIKPIVCV